MKLVTGLSTNPNQLFRVPLDDGSIVKLTIKYKSRPGAWFLDVEYKSFTLRGKKLFNSLNVLRQYKNIIPFGLNVVCPEGTEPILINDFSSGRCTLNVLTASEVEELESAYKDANA